MTEETNSILLQQAHDAIVNLKNLLMDRLVNEQLEETGTEQHWFARANEITKNLRKELINGPKVAPIRRKG